VTMEMAPNTRVLVQFDEARASIRSVISRLEGQQVALNGAWGGPEMRYVNACIDATQTELRAVLAEIDSISAAVRRVPNQLRGPASGPARDCWYRG